MTQTFIPDVISSFSGDYERLSNFYPVLIHFEGMNFPSVEHAYVAAKTKDRMKRYMIAMLDPDKAGEAKRIGRTFILREDWEMIKLSVMKRCLIQKFLYDEFRSFLLSTGESNLMEGNYWHDNYWGNCLCRDCAEIQGQNQLGKMLMEVREKVR